MSSWVPDALWALRRALAGDSAPLEFLPAAGEAPRWIERPEASEAAESLRTGERPAVVVRTSGSTGTPKQTLLSAENLRASAEATAQALGGHGRWLLTLQPSYVAGLAVLSRSLVAGTAPVALLEHTTDPAAFREAVDQLGEPHREAERRYTSLVPTQLLRLLEASAHDDDLLQALRSFHAILLGGGPVPPELRAKARGAGLRVVATYGMSETAGGCVYDGRPLPGVRITVEPGDSDESAAGAPSARWSGTGDPDTPGGGPDGFDLARIDSSGSAAAPAGRLRLSGPMVAAGYLDPELSSARFDVDPETGHRRFLTDDIGRLEPAHREHSPEGHGPHRPRPFAGTMAVGGAGAPGSALRLTVTGRVDDVINTGGVKVSAEKVRQVLEADPEIREAFVAGVPHPEWGQTVSAAVVLEDADQGEFVPLPTDDGGVAELPEHPPRGWLRALNATVRQQLGPAAVPKEVRYMRALPLLANGKPDRQALMRLLHSE